MCINYTEANYLSNCIQRKTEVRISIYTDGLTRMKEVFSTKKKRL